MSARDYELTGTKSVLYRTWGLSEGLCQHRRLGVHLAGAWLPYAWPAEGDIYTFRTIPAGYSNDQCLV